MNKHTRSPIVRLMSFGMYDTDVRLIPICVLTRKKYLIEFLKWPAKMSEFIRKIRVLKLRVDCVWVDE